MLKKKKASFAEGRAYDRDPETCQNAEDMWLWVPSHHWDIYTATSTDKPENTMVVGPETKNESVLMLAASYCLLDMPGMTHS